jgi:hypothetical protein
MVVDGITKAVGDWLGIANVGLKVAEAIVSVGKEGVLRTVGV